MLRLPEEEAADLSPLPGRALARDGQRQEENELRRGGDFHGERDTGLQANQNKNADHGEPLVARTAQTL